MGSFLYRCAVLAAAFIFGYAAEAQWMKNPDGPANETIRSAANDGSQLYMGTNGGVYVSANHGTSWTSANTGGLATLRTIQSLYALGTTDVFAGTFEAGAFVTSDGGASWTQINTGLTVTDIREFIAVGTTMFVGTNGAGIFKSVDKGAHWTPVTVAGLTNPVIYVFTSMPGYLFAGSGGNGVFRSTDNGDTWTAVNTGLSDLNTHALAVIGTDLYVGTGNGVSKSVDHGDHWTNANAAPLEPFVHVLTVSGTTLFAGTDGGVFRSDDGAATWTAVNAGWDVIPRVDAILLDGTNIYAGTRNYGIYLQPAASVLPVELAEFTARARGARIQLQWKTSTERDNYGFEIERRSSEASAQQTWTVIGFVNGSGTTNSPRSYAFSDECRSASTYLYRLKQIDRNGSFEYSGEVEARVTAPQALELFQNFPNPFNPSTTVSFTVPTDGHARLSIVNTLGQEASLLFDGEARAGSEHIVRFNASGFASGIYFSRLEYDGRVIVKPMQLIK